MGAPALLLTLALLPDASQAIVVRGDVRRDDDTTVAGAPVVVSCGEWRHDTRTDDAGRFRVDDVPAAEACTVRAEWPGRPGHGLDISRRFDGDAYVRLTLPTPLALPTTPSTPGGDLRLSFTERPGPEGTRLPGGWSLRGTRSLGSALPDRPSMPSSGAPLIAVPLAPPPPSFASSPGLVLPWSPTSGDGPVPRSVFTTDAAQGWSVGVAASRRGPWGTLFTGTARARREGLPSTLMNDVTETPMGSPGAWSLLADPGTPTLWDVRLRLERRFEVGTTDVTVFGEAYRSWLQGPSGTGPLLPLGGERSSSRSGAAGRVGVTFGF